MPPGNYDIMRLARIRLGQILRNGLVVSCSQFSFNRVDDI